MRRVPVNRTINIICGVFLVCGLAFLGISIYTISNTRSFVAQAEMARGEVVDLEYRRDNSGSSASGGAYYPVVKYRTAAGDQRTLYGNTGSSPPSYRVGEAVDVLYAPTNPSDARIAGFFSLWLVALITGVLGWLFSLGGAGVMIARRVAARRVRDLRLHGTPVETEVQNVEMNGGFEVNGRSPWRIVTRWLDPTRNELHLFHSENLWFDPTPFINSKRVVVFIDPNNPKRYSMDVSFLPTLVS